ncbi:MAG: hypothetical protein U5L09_06445 [Bacteroidales bacterium]|nr:hypothetical protein [Bacteroidales bacterium]
MNNEFGEKAYPVWLLSEIELSFWEQKLNGPFDYRLPMRHVICTSVFNKIQETVYRLDKRRVDTERFYIRNTLPANLDKPNINDVIWEENILKELDRLKKDIESLPAKSYLSFRRIYLRKPAPGA